MNIDWIEIEKIINNTASDDEVAKFNVWLSESVEHKMQFDKMKDFYNNPENEEYQKSCARESKYYPQVIISANKRQKNISLIKRSIAIAAAFIGVILCVNVFYNPSNNTTVRDTITQNGSVASKAPVDNDIVIKTEHGEILHLDGNTEVEGAKLNEEENTITYNKAQKVEYHTICIPRGKTLNLILSDGTKVYLNSESELKYPNRFIEGKERKVFLKGEAYLEVVNDKNTQFVVGVNDMNVKVYGTKFNINSYTAFVKTVLVEGSIAIESHNREKMIAPNEIAIFEKHTGIIDVKSCDVTKYTSWVDGYITFEEEEFGNIVTILERIYNVEIEFANPRVESLVINCHMMKGDSLSQFLDKLKDIGKLNYTVVDNKYILR